MDRRQLVIPNLQLRAFPTHSRERSTTQRIFPKPLPCGVRCRAKWSSILRSLSPCRFRGVPYCRSPYRAFGLRRGRPRRPRIGGMSSTKFIASSDSLRLAPVMRTASGVPWPSTSKCRFVPFFGPIGGVFAGQYPPKTARKLWLSTQQCSQSMPFSCRRAGVEHVRASSRPHDAASIAVVANTSCPRHSPSPGEASPREGRSGGRR